MSGRVLSSEQARQAIQKMQQLINGPLAEQIDALNREGQTLSDPSVWDGNRAQEFRNDWPQMHQTLTQAKQSLEDLRARIDAINRDIMTAGGNS